MSSWLSQPFGLFTGTTFVFGLGAYLYGSCIEAKRYQLEKLCLDLSSHFNSNDKVHKPRQRRLRILHLSDLHLCHPESEKIEFIRKVTEEEFDLVVITGDVFEDYSGLIYASSLLSKYPRMGAYAVLGNHDYYNYKIFNKILGRIFTGLRHPDTIRDVRPMIKALEDSGISVLRNETANHAQYDLHIVGIDYPTVHPVSLNELTARADDNQLILILFHLPVNLDNIKTAGAHLALGGHTHGGQICIPGWGAIITDSELPRKEASGLFFRGKTAFHVSRGLSADPRTNVRLFCPPAATIIDIIY